MLWYRSGQWSRGAPCTRHFRLVDHSIPVLRSRAFSHERAPETSAPVTSVNVAGSGVGVAMKS